VQFVLNVLEYTVAKACTIPRIWTWFTRLFFLMRGWGVGMRLQGETCRVFCVLVSYVYIYLMGSLNFTQWLESW